jgi:membrane protease YdiL (CAAX protease family)
VGNSSAARRPLAFFALVFALAVPFWLIGGALGWVLLPGLPVTALMAICPGIAALILVRNEDGSAGVTALLKRGIDTTRIRALWYAPILLLMPCIMVLAFAMQRVMGVAVPVPDVSIASALLLCLLFFAGAFCEELGWSGYVTDPLQDRWGVLPAAILLGAVWATFHFVALLQAHHSLEWIAWWSLGTVASRVLIVWLYDNTGKSVFAATLFHMTVNVTWQLFPVHGSFFDPRITGLITVGAAMLVALIWRPRKPARS